ncbi:MAG: sulfatase-like hydrolase/transferase [Desulfomonilaceae bacterium]
MSDLVLAWFPALVVFVMAPFAVYLPNQEEFHHDLRYVAPFLTAAAASFAALAPVLLLRSSLRNKIVKFLFYAGVFLLLSDLLTPLKVGSLMNGPEEVTPQALGFRDVLDLILLAVTVMIAVKAPFNKIKNWAVPFVIVLFLVETMFVVQKLPVKKMFTKVTTTRGLSAAVPSTAKKGNVYQVCFDGMSSLAFLDALKDSGREADFDGFTFFRNNRSNYIFTMESVPSYFTGSFFKGGSYEAWNKNRIKGGMVKDLHDSGYTISMYVPDSTYLNDNAERKVTSMDVFKENQGIPTEFQYPDFADLWLLRVAPAFLEGFVYDSKGMGIFRKIFAAHVGPETEKEQREGPDSSECLFHVPIMEKVVTEEEQRPREKQYVYVHTLVTHSPWGTRSRQCAYLPQRGGTYFDHTVCATNLMAELISKLKQLGKYKESTIIFQSDHGAEPMSPSGNQCRMPRSVGARITSATRYSPYFTCRRTFGLLLIKPAGAAGTPLKVSDSPTQLADIPATVYDILGLPFTPEVGKSVFSLSESEEREIHMFSGFVGLDPNGVVVFAGKQVFNGNLFHLSYTRGKGWKAYPEIPWTWD